MDPGRRAFLEKYAVQWAQRAGDRRRLGTIVDLQIAKTLEGFVAEMRAELAANPAPASAPALEIVNEITWKSPVFYAGGRFNPFAGTKREGWLASADACERLGCPDAAATLRQLAADVDPHEMPDCTRTDMEPAPTQRTLRPAVVTRSAARKRSSWTGPPMPPPEPIPFKAAGQMDMFA